MKENENKYDTKQNILLPSATRAKRCVHRERDSEGAVLDEQPGAWRLSHVLIQHAKGDMVLDTTLLHWSHRPFQAVWLWVIGLTFCHSGSSFPCRIILSPPLHNYYMNKQQ